MKHPVLQFQYSPVSQKSTARKNIIFTKIFNFIGLIFTTIFPLYINWPNLISKIIQKKIIQKNYTEGRKYLIFINMYMYRAWWFAYCVTTATITIVHENFTSSWILQLLINYSISSHSTRNRAKSLQNTL